MLKTPSILIDGSPPRYERLGFYMDFSTWDDPSYSTEKHAQRWLDDLDNANREPPESLGKAIDAAVELVAMRHFQFAGAPDVRDRVVEASELALAYFQACARNSKADDSFAWLKIRRLLHGLLLCALAKRWETFEKVCNAVRPKLASADTTDDEDVDDYAQVLLLFVSNYRDRPLPKAAALEQAVRNAEPGVLVYFWMCAAPSPRVEKPILRKRCEARSSIFWRCGQKKKSSGLPVRTSRFNMWLFPRACFIWPR